MALNLDARQRAMLQDMGITLWLPRTPAAAHAHALAAAADADAGSDTAVLESPALRTESVPAPVPAPVALAVPASSPVQAAAPQVPAAAAPASAPVAVPTAPAAAPADPRPAAVPVADVAGVYRAPAPVSAPWVMGPLVHAFADGAHTQPAPDAGWLVVVEAADVRDPFAGEAGALLHNMLRALRLQLHPQVRIAPLTRQALPDAASGADGAQGAAASPVTAPDAALQPIEEALPAAIAAHRPARVLVMGLHAARAVLGRSEALGRLRAEVHQLHGAPAVVTYDPAYLLRAAHAKPGAWSDLCRAHALQPPAA